MTIELTGLPGCGKSYISRDLALRLRNAGLKVTEPARRIGHSATPTRIAAKLGVALLFLLFHPLRGIRVLQLVLSSGQRGLGNLAGSLFNLLFVAGLMTLPRRGDILLLDQGPLQGLASLYYGADTPTAVDQPAGLPAPDLIIRVVAEREVILARLASRRSGGGSRVEADPERELPLFKDALAAAERSGFARGIPVIESPNNGEDSLENTLQSLVSSILEIKNKD